MAEEQTWIHPKKVTLVETVKEMLRDMYERLEVRNRAHMVTVAFRRGWLT